MPAAVAPGPLRGVANSNVRAAVTRSLARPNYYDTVPYRAQDDAAAHGLARQTWICSRRAAGTWTCSVSTTCQVRRRASRPASSTSGCRTTSTCSRSTTRSAGLGLPRHAAEERRRGHGARRRARAAEPVVVPARPRCAASASTRTTRSRIRAPRFRDTRAAVCRASRRHVGNVAASYERFGFSGRVSVNFHGSYVDQIGADATLLDRFYDQATQLDLSLTQKVTRNLRVVPRGPEPERRAAPLLSGRPEASAPGGALPVVDELRRASVDF